MNVMTISADCDHDSSIHIELLDHSTTDHDTSSTQRSTRNLWRQVLLVFRAHARLYSIIQNGGNTLITTDPGVNPDESSSYTVLLSHNDDAGDDEASAQNSATDHLDIRLDIHNSSSSNNNDSSSNNNNSINVETLSSVVKEKNLDFLSEHGGVEGIAAALDTNLENGISSEAEDVHRRQDAYGTNTYGEALTSSKSFFYFFFKAAIDWTNLLLFCCAALSLGSGIKEEGLKNGWYDGTIIFISIIVLISATTIKNYCLSRNSKKLRNENSLVIQVLRRGQPQSISIFDVVVGDIVFLKIGDLVPADGLFIKGENLKVDDDDVLHDSRIDRVENPFLYCGAKVIEGSAHMLVTSVGRNTAWGEMMSTVNHDTRKHTLIQVRLDKLNTYLQNIGLFLAILILVVLLLRYLMGKTDDESGYPDQISKRSAVGELMKAVERFLTNPRGFRASLTTVLAILLVGIQEGLPLIITISLSYWNGRMVKLHQIIIRELCGCVTMGAITTICTNKTAELTLDLEEVMFWVGEEEVMFWVGEEAIGRDNVSIISQDVLEAICNGVATPGLVCDTSTSPTKDPLLRWAVSNLGMDMEQLKKNQTILIRETFSSDRKKSGLLMRKNGDAEKAIHLHWRGSADTILAMCSDYYKSNGDIKTMDKGKRAVFQKVIEKMTAKGLQSIAFAHRLIEDDGDTEDDVRKLHEDGLILLGLLGIKYSCCPEARSAVDAFLHAGISIKLVSPESLPVLISIAIQYGILQSGQDLNSLVLEGEEFRKLSEAERLEKVDQITVMGSSLPSDKLLFIQCLRRREKPSAQTEKKSGLLMRKNGNAEKAIHLHWRGSADTILAMCSDYYKSNGDIKTMDEGKRGVFQKVIEKMTAKGLQSIAFAHRLIEDDSDTADDVRKLHEDGLILLGLLGIKYSCYPEARSAVDAFLHAGISIKLVSPESLLVLISIAIQYGILQSGQDLNSLVLEGEEFRKLSEAERLEKVDQITVMGSSLPSDKLLFIQCLRRRGQVVAVTGVTASDSPALKEADVGLLMGTQNSEMAKESSDIVIASGHLASMVTVLLFGRCAYKNIQKFIQLELTINISGLLITFVTTVSLGEAPITPLQLLLVNLMVGTLAALALWTGSPTKETLKMPPVNQTESLITKAMWRNIFIQVCYQAVVLLMFQFKGQILPGMNWKLKKSMILNGFILCQVFNQFNARESEKKNVFKGILNNHWFLVAVGAPIVLQVVVVEFATSLSCTERLNWLQWLACILFAIMSWPIDYVVKCI
ncbi:Cation-transporting P-type ATPase [Macleaya cordata]|uniref:Cation-transporting P-type ATPase n=1 Tax=Macleaya cordata TaxID=56857 RepID=A0A200RBU8_MACCD|nr:Cation-transporting P-type ATPase [Macleaya cordata]